MGLQKTFYQLLWTLIVCVGLLMPVYAQSSGSTTSAITGAIRDTQGIALAGAKVVARELKTNVVREAQTNEEGVFSLTQLPPGDYEIRIAADGFAEKAVRTDLTIGNTTLVNVDLAIANVSDEVIIQAGGIMVEGRTERSTNIESNEIVNLPINRRDFLDFTLITPGVSPDRVSVSGSTATSGLSFNGQSARSNNITIDGLDNNELGNGTARTTFSQDAVQEFQVVNGNAPAELGRALGGIINIVTKSGTNEFHGTLFNFLRDDDISARDAFAPFKADFRQYQFGATLGGPIKKERSFFFASFERTSTRQNNIVTISDALVRSIRNIGLNATNGPIPIAEGRSLALVRTDFQITPNDRLTVRYNYGGVFNGALQTFGGLRDQTAGGALGLDDNTVAVSNTLISPGLNVINETRFLYTRREQGLAPLDSNGPSLNIFAPEGLVTVGRDPLLPQVSTTNFYEIVNNLTIPRGNHQIKTGVDAFFLRIPDNEISIPVLFGGLSVFSPINFSQILGIPGLPSFSAAEALDPSLRSPIQQIFLQGASIALPGVIPGFPAGVPLDRLPLPLSFLQGFGNPRSRVNFNYVSAYVQDDFRVRPNLLIKAGIRYDRESIEFAPKNDGNFSPRIALFYRPRNSDKLSLSASYGIFHGATPYAGALVTDFLDGQKVVTPVLPFPFSVLPFSLPGRRFPSSSSLPAGLQFVPQLARDTVISPSFRNGYAQEANFSVNYLFSPFYGVSASYQYVRGVKIFLARNINPVVRPIPNDPITSQIVGRVNPTRGELISFETSGDSYHSAATFSFFARTPKRLSVLAHLTLAKTIDNYIDSLRVDILEFQNPLDLKSERALSLQDIRGRFVISTTYNLAGARNPFIRNFEISNIITLNSGQPFNLLAGADIDGNGDLASPGDRPGNIGRNAGRNQGFASVDLRVARTLNINERFQLTGYVEAFNLFNRLNVSDVNRVFPIQPDGTFALPQQEDGRFVVTPDRFTGAFRPRQVQIGMRFTF